MLSDTKRTPLGTSATHGDGFSERDIREQIFVCPEETLTKRGREECNHEYERVKSTSHTTQSLPSAILLKSARVKGNRADFAHHEGT